VFYLVTTRTEGDDVSKNLNFSFVVKFPDLMTLYRPPKSFTSAYFAQPLGVGVTSFTKNIPLRFWEFGTEV
jgi:hypothetical protein